MTSDNHHDICNGVTIYSLGIECGYRTWTNMTHFSDDLPIKTGFPLPERPMSFPHCHKPGFSFGYALPIEMIFLVRLYNVCKIVSNWDVSPTSSLNVGYKRNVTSPVGTNRHGKIFTENWGWKIGSSGWIHQAGHLDIFHPQMVSPPVFSFFFYILFWADVTEKEVLVPLERLDMLAGWLIGSKNNIDDSPIERLVSCELIANSPSQSRI